MGKKWRHERKHNRQEYKFYSVHKKKINGFISCGNLFSKLPVTKMPCKDIARQDKKLR